MKIAAYVQMNRVYNPTGVGKHVINMTRCLSKMPGVDLHMMTSRQFLPDGKSLPAENPLRNIPATGIPWPRRPLDACWLLLGHPVADRWADGADWIYNHVEDLVPTRRSRVAVTCHDIRWLEVGMPWYSKEIRWRDRAKWRLRMAQVRRRADVIFVVSEFTRQRVAELAGINIERIVVIGNGVDPEYFSAAQQPRDNSQQPYLLVIGGLSKMKGGVAVLETAKVLQQRKSEIQIWVVGKSQAHLMQCAEAFRNIRHLGYVESNRLATLLRGAVALLFPSQYEGFGIPAAEAMAAGTPPIVSSFAALPEVVGDGGIILDSNADAGEITDIAVRLASDEEYRSSIAQRGIERAKTFTWERCVERVLETLCA